MSDEQDNVITLPPPRRGRGRPFTAGDPRTKLGGRPRKDARARMLLERATPAAVSFLTRVLRDENEPTSRRIEAANTLLQYQWGKPSVAQVAVGVQVGAPAPQGHGEGSLPPQLQVLLDRLRARQGLPPAPESSGPAPAAIAPPGATSGAAGGGGP